MRKRVCFLETKAMQNIVLKPPSHATQVTICHTVKIPRQEEETGNPINQPPIKNIMCKTSQTSCWLEQLPCSADTMARLHVTMRDGTREGSLEQTASVLGYRGDRTHEQDLRGVNKAQGMLLQEKNLYLTMTVGDDTEKPWHNQKGSPSSLLANWSHMTFRFTLVAT